jgi:phenylalanyl-tRNA synthetase alpha chain
LETPLEDWLEKIENSSSKKELEEVRVAIFGKKGVLTQSFAKMKSIPNMEKAKYAKDLNTLKSNLTKALSDKSIQLLKQAIIDKMKEEAVDVSLYSKDNTRGAYHPVVETMDKIVSYFENLNFSVENGPMIEDDFHNFEALNLPKFHPARDMQDTFYLKDSMLLRTHTSPTQIRKMKNNKPPIRMISPGAVFRRDLDLTHTPMFHQVEGLVVQGENEVSFANLKYILENFLRFMFGDIEIRFRPSFFPFTEPSAEADISCVFCKGKGCRVCSNTGWLEVLGCGMVDENVFEAVGYKKVSGYAFGLGVERFAMLIHQIPDLRALFEGDIRLLEQFR